MFLMKKVTSWDTICYQNQIRTQQKKQKTFFKNSFSSLFSLILLINPFRKPFPQSAKHDSFRPENVLSQTVLDGSMTHIAHFGGLRGKREKDWYLGTIWCVFWILNTCSVPTDTERKEYSNICKTTDRVVVPVSECGQYCDFTVF